MSYQFFQATEWPVLAALFLGSPAPTIADDRVRVDAANDEELMPYIVGHTFNVRREYGLDNTLLEVHTKFHVECWGETREQAALLSRQVTACLEAAGYPLDPSGPDGIDLNVDARCVDLFLSVIDTPPIED